MVKLKHAWLCFAFLLLLILSSCGNSPTTFTKEPKLFLPKQFQWQQENQKTELKVAIPTTSNNPGPVVNETVHHEQGLGLLLTDSNISQKETVAGQQVIAVATNGLKKLGWQPLFPPTTTGSYPNYVLYVTFRSTTYYCFVEYTATILDHIQASQQLDIFYS
jgi:hypothetical protein